MTPDFRIDIEPDAEKVLSELIKAEIAEVLDDAAGILPDEIRALMQAGGTSQKGEPPRRRTGTLAGSLKAEAKGAELIELEMAGHGFYLEPLFEGEGKGGGWADRPFVDEGLRRTVEEIG